MGKVVVINHIPLDGVMRGPRRRDEDTRGEFAHGGWAASHNPATRLEWLNSTLVDGDVPATVAELKQASSSNLVIMGSGELIAALMAADLIDEYLLVIHSLVLGTGRRLFLRPDAHLCC